MISYNNAKYYKTIYLLVFFLLISLKSPSYSYQKDILFKVEAKKNRIDSTFIQVTGTGRVAGDLSSTQARLLAKRAAVVDGYRKLAVVLNNTSEIISKDSFYITADGFIKGAQILNTRFLIDGTVEVDLGLLAKLRRGSVRLNQLNEILSKKDYAICEYTYKPKGEVISKEEWLELIEEKNK